MDNKTIAHQIAARVKLVPGYIVSKPRSLSGAYRVKCPDDFVIQIHLTPSDKNFDKTIWRLLTAHGFMEAEEKHQEQARRDRAADLETQRQKAAKKAEELANRSATLQRAMGPYAAPDAVEFAWFAQKHPAPWHRWCLMAPELAGRIVDELNNDNRKLRPKTVEHYRNVILSGQWHLTHQGMAIDQRGILQDGQHRLEAIRQAAVTVPVSFYVGMPPENFKAIDEGLLRRAADLVSAAGAEGYASMTAAVVKLVDAYDSIDPRRAYYARLTNESVHDLFKLDAAGLREAVRYGSSHYKRPKLNATGLAAAYYLIRKANGADNLYVEAFFSGLINGQKGDSRMMLDDDDPRTRLREMVANYREKGKRLNALDGAALIIMAWNFVVEDHRPKFMRIADNMDIPKPAQCAPEGRFASAPPACLAMEVNYARDAAAALALAS